MATEGQSYRSFFEEVLQIGHGALTILAHGMSLAGRAKILAAISPVLIEDSLCAVLTAFVVGAEIVVCTIETSVQVRSASVAHVAKPN